MMILYWVLVLKKTILKNEVVYNLILKSHYLMKSQKK